MKRMLIILFIIMMALSGCSSPGAQKENADQNVSSEDKSDSIFNYAKPLTLAQVTTAMMLEGLPFSKNQEESPDDYAINNVTPAIYTVKQNDNILMIYIYESIAFRKEACENSEGMGYFVSSKLPQKENWLTVAYTAKNVLIIDRLNIEKYQSNPTDFEQVLKPLRTAADSLNDTKELVFADKGNYWDASLTVKYYQYWYKDNTDTSHIDQQSNEKWLVKYLGSDPESIHDLKCEYTYKGGSAGGNDSGPGLLQKIGKDYYLRLGNSETSSIPDKNDIYALTIQWDSKKESLHLKMINQ